MKVFVTGASGWVGTVVCNDLTSHGHTVLGLARSDASAKVLTDKGYEAHRGSLDDLESITAAVKAADGVIHCAYKHDFSSAEAIENATQTELAVLTAIGEALQGTTKPFVFSSAAGGLPGVDGQPANEEAVLPAYIPRSITEAHALAFADKGVHVSAVRLPFTVHGVRDPGFVKMLIDMARNTGSVPLIGEGLNRWPAVHVTDAAPVYRLALEKSKVRGIYHAVQDTGVETREIAKKIGEHLDLPVKALTADEAAALGFVGMVMGADSPVSSARTREELGWMPAGPTLLEDLANAEYYK
ncbi:putative NAD-dependent epimerase/dehydratase [Pseudohyphozyma bogoriensis]|nr:putative NAD-dependent epimerase/dehydratase [Pseudohyphozyma bogoriensis]